MEVPQDEDGGSRVPSRPTAKKKDVLDDPALADAGPALISPGEIVDQAPNLSKAVPEESRPHGVDQGPSDGAPGVSGNPDDVAPQSGSNSGDTGPETDSIDPEDVAPVDGNPGGVTAEVVQNPSNVALGEISKHNDVAQAGVGVIPARNVCPGAVFNSGDLGPAAMSNRDDVAPAVQNSGNVSHGMAGSFDDDALGAGENPNDVASEAVSNPSDVALGVVGEPGNVALGVILDLGDGGLVAVSNPNDAGSMAGTSSDVGSGVVGNPEDVTGAAQNVNDVVPRAISNRNDAKQGLVGNPGTIGSGVAGNSDDDALGTVEILSDVPPGADVLNLDNVAPGVNPENVVGESVLNSSYNRPVAAPNLDSVAHLAGNPSDVADGPVQSPGNGEQSNTVELGQDGASEIEHQNEEQNPRNIFRTAIPNADPDEILWSRAVAEQDCKELTKLLAKEVRYFWWYEKENEVGTALHAAATGGDLELAERVLNLLSCGHEAGDPNMRFLDTRLNVDCYVELERDGKRAAAMAQEKNHDAIEKRICEYIADKEQRRIHDMQRSRGSATVTSGNRAPAVVLKWNDAIKRKDCLALLQICPNVGRGDASDVERKLIGELVKVEVKNGKGGRQTALQTAAMQGCFQLVKSMLNHMDEWCPNRDVLKYILARDEESGLTAFEMANDVIGNRSISELIKFYYKECSGNDNLLCRLRVNMVNDDHRVGYDSYFRHEALVSFDAYPGTRWYRALGNGDTIELKKLVEVNSRFILETWHGLTVLHVAILWNDLELVKAVFKLFCNIGKDGNNPTIKWGEPYYPITHLGKSYYSSIRWGKSYYPEELSLDDMMRVDRKIDPGYLDKYWNASSDKWQSLLLGDLLDKLEKGGFTIQSFADVISDPKWIREAWENARNVSTMNTDDEYISTMSPRMQNFFTQNLPPTFDGEFQKDVDFNFEDQTWKDWLKFHYACKDPLKFNDFLQKMASYIMQHPYDAAKLLQTWDGKGRTPFHILMDHYNDEKDPGWPFHEIFNHDLFNEWIQIAENPRGKRMIDILLTKNYLQQNVKLQPWTYCKVNFSYEKFENSEESAFLCYQLAACFEKQKDLVQEIWSTLLEKKDLTNVMKKDRDAFNSMLFIAASTGNQTFLHLLLETNHDPMVTDPNGRSLLHHVADPTILLSHLLGYCSLTIEDFVDVKRKLMGSNPIYYPQPSSDSSTRNISLEERSNVGRRACILMLLQAGVDLGQPDKDNKVPTIGPTTDANYQSWWHDMVVKDSTDKKNAMSQAGNALSVVGTLVAATSYVGPLQPPLGFDDKVGFVKTSEPLIKVFMVSNSVAFYLAMASVMFAVVSSLPMPREGVISELNRAKHVISLSLCLLQIAIGSIIISYATASIVAIQNENLFHPSDLLFIPSIIGWFFCLFGIGGFLIRLARLMFYKNQIVQNIYQFSFSKFTLKCLWVIIVGPLYLICLVLARIFFGLDVISSNIPMLERRGVNMVFYRIRSRLCDIATSLRM